MADFSIIIVGAGIVGLAVGRELAESGFSVGILEKNCRYGLETSSRNSEVLHSGIHYPPGSLKACLCVQGNELLTSLVKEHGLMYLPCGKLTLAVKPEEESNLYQLKQQGEKNGVPGLKLLTGKQLSQIEPEIKAVSGLLTPTTGVCNAHQVMDFLAEKFRQSGGLMGLNSRVTGIEWTGHLYRVSVQQEKVETYTAYGVVNCAGLFSDDVSRMLGPVYRLYWAKGDYFSAHNCPRVKHLIYPLPSSDSLGIHVTPGIAGGYRLGPDIQYVEKQSSPYPDEKGNPGYGIDAGKGKIFRQKVACYLPGIEKAEIFPETYGLRPKIQGPDEPFQDFIIKEEKERGFPHFINLIGIESPGLTACLAIARLVRKFF